MAKDSKPGFVGFAFLVHGRVCPLPGRWMERDHGSRTEGLVGPTTQGWFWRVGSKQTGFGRCFVLASLCPGERPGRNRAALGDGPVPPAGPNSLSLAQYRLLWCLCSGPFGGLPPRNRGGFGVFGLCQRCPFPGRQNLWPPGSGPIGRTRPAPSLWRLSPGSDFHLYLRSKHQGDSATVPKPALWASGGRGLSQNGLAPRRQSLGGGHGRSPRSSMDGV